MAMLSAASIRCPECAEPIPVPRRATLHGRKVTLALDLAPLREHASTHEAVFTTELPPTARSRA
ncbi:hypothetical protein [Streptomyces sp. NPDC002692]